MDIKTIVSLILISVVLCVFVYAYLGERAYNCADRCTGTLTKRKRGIYLAVLYAAAAVLLVFAMLNFFSGRGWHGDLNVYNNWGNWIADNGADGFYDANEMAMPPLFLLLCCGIYLFSRGTGCPFDIAFRVFFSLVFLLSVIVFYRVARKESERGALAAVLLYALCPALLINAGLWGQSDAVPCLFTILIYSSLREKKYLLSFVWLFLGLSAKLQLLFVLPCLAVWVVYSMIREKKWGRLLVYGACFAACLWLSYLPFGITRLKNGDPFLIFDVLLGVADNKSFYTSFALNFWFAAGRNLAVASAAWRYAGYAAVLLASAGISFMLIRSEYEHKLLVAASLQVMAFFFFSIAMLERYLIGVIPLLLLLCMHVQDKTMRRVSLMLVSINFFAEITTLIATHWGDRFQSYEYTLGAMFVFSLLNIAMFVLFVFYAVRLLFPGLRVRLCRKKGLAEKEEPPAENLSVYAAAPQTAAAGEKATQGADI